MRSMKRGNVNQLLCFFLYSLQRLFTPTRSFFSPLYSVLQDKRAGARSSGEGARWTVFLLS
jgi:hypothetical protein